LHSSTLPYIRCKEASRRVRKRKVQLNDNNTHEVIYQERKRGKIGAGSDRTVVRTSHETYTVSCRSSQRHAEKENINSIKYSRKQDYYSRSKLQVSVPPGRKSQVVRGIKNGHQGCKAVSGKSARGVIQKSKRRKWLLYTASVNKAWEGRSGKKSSHRQDLEEGESI
jgi:hypothetical protein